MTPRISIRSKGMKPAGQRLPRRSTVAGLLILVVLTGGCIATGPREWLQNGMKVGPNYCRPPAPVAAEYAQSRHPKVSDRHLHDWWKVFEDETLCDLLHTAYKQNLSLRVLGTRILQARAQASISAGNLFAQTQQIRGFFSDGTFNGQRSDLDFVGFNLSWEADVWGRIRRSIESANANFDASVENYDDALVTLLADVATNYVRYRVAQQRIKIARANVKIQEDILVLVEQQQRVGINRVTMLDVNQARTVLEQTRATIPALQITLGEANDTICTLLGVPPHDLSAELGPGPPLGESPMPGTPTWAAVGLPADLLRNRPDVRSAERQVAAQSAQIGVAEADLYPTLAINGTLGWDYLRLDNFLRGQGFLALITPTFNWRILNYGRIVNNVRYQQARTLELIATYQNTVLRAAREVQVPLRGFLRSQEQSEDLRRSVEAAGGALKIGRNQYRVGTIPFNTVFNLATTQVLQQDALATAQGNIALNLVNVYRALGAGWELRYHPEACCDLHAKNPSAEEGQLPASAGDSLPLPRQESSTPDAAEHGDTSTPATNATNPG